MALDSEFVKGWYFDGRNANRTAVEVARRLSWIAVVSSEGKRWQWMNEEWRPVIDPAHRWVRIEKLPYAGECVLVEDEEFVRALVAERGDRLLSRGGWRPLVVLTIAAVTVGASIWMGYPLMMDRLVEKMPVGMESRFGAAVSNALSPERERMRQEGVAKPVAKIVARLTEKTPSRYEWDVSVADEGMVNAWAAPGGHVVVYRGLLCELESADQLAAVMGHEMMHVVKRHSSRSLAKTLGVRLGIALVLGGGDQLLDGAVMMAVLHNMRGYEDEADREALMVLRRAAVNPIALAEAFALLEKKTPKLPGMFDYLSTHPPLAKRRAEALAAVEKAGNQQWRPVLEKEEWEMLREECNCE